MNFTPALPTEPGMYMWKTKEGDSPMFLEVEIGEEETEVIWRGYVDPISKYPGLWCKLEPEKPKCIQAIFQGQYSRSCYRNGIFTDEVLTPLKFCPHCGGEIEIETRQPELIFHAKEKRPEV